MSKVLAEDMNRFFRENFKGDRGALPDITLAEADHIIMEAPMGEKKHASRRFRLRPYANDIG